MGCPLRFTYDASGENAFAIRLDFDQRKDAEEFVKHFNPDSPDEMAFCQLRAPI